MPIIGLDLGRHNFRAVEIDKEKNGKVLLKYGIYDAATQSLPSSQAPTNKTLRRIDFNLESQNDLQNYSKAVKEFFSEMCFTTHDVIASLPESQVFMRVIKVPEMSDRELEKSILYEAEQYIPLPLKEVNLSFLKIDPDYDDKGKMNVQLVAAKKSTLEKYVILLKEAHLTPRAMEPETLSLGRILGDSDQKPLPTIVVNIGFDSTLIIITYRGFVRFTRSLAYGGDTLTRSVQQSLNLDYMQAEEYKKAYGMDNSQVEGKIFNVLKPVFDNLILEIKRSKIFFTTHNPDVTINRVVLAGGTALMPGLLIYFATNLDMEVELANPWKSIQLSSKLEASKDFLLEQGPVLSTSVGLAIKEI